MDLKDLAIGTVFLLQSTVGIVGNFSLLSCYLIRYYIDQTLKTTDLILTHLFTANCLIIFSKGMLETIGALGMKTFFSGFGCKLLLYVQRLGRSMSIGTTCLLSIVQAITISPSDSCWNCLKFKAPKHIGLFTSLCWMFYMSVNMIFPVYMSINGHNNNLTQESDMKYCSTAGHDGLTSSLYMMIFVLPEILLSVLMIWSSSSMVVILYRHKQQVQHIRSSTASSRTSPEARATQSILVLVFTFLGFYALSSILQGCVAIIYSPGWWLMNITAIISMCFPTVGPFVMSHDATVPRLCYS
ncbi:LOW QUALITY PROTEIN: vomeronasal type-1 receptor 4-like [Phodopus roborovskii]|uniref:LOW QUALITY PROTEIN: vomeronasal type-1 receptor 4-like n=1 Tax=Phodopus roborovskii TaxID=109678 RepID=UPI0021E50333|nr:LOW QUALITY PROTEIN: vomeronasal type-1 receptor 4-like [Phodopus roborovskii]